MPSSPIDTRPTLTWSQPDSTDIAAALTAEWLETNGLGDFAASTVPMCATRRYHGLLVARPVGSPKRHVFLTRFEEHLAGPDGSRQPLSIAAYPGVCAPRGHEALEEFELAPFPTFRYRVGDATVTREVMMVRGAQTVLVRYVFQGAAPGTSLELEPMFACREADALTVENDVLDASLRRKGRGDAVGFDPYEGLPSVWISGLGGDLEERALWYKDVQFAADERRGYPSSEDQFSPLVARVPVADDKPIVIAATLGDPIADPARLWRSEAKKRSAARDAVAPADSDLGAWQQLAARDFLTDGPAAASASAPAAGTGSKRGSGRTKAARRLGVNAGYPWFVEWGRDTFISLPGLTLGRDEPERLFAGLMGAREFLRDGLLPNVYGLGPEDSAYNSADAALWFARAVRIYERATGETKKTGESFAGALREIAEAYRDGTELGLSMDAAGLLVAGRSDLNATWMDAMVDGQPVTPRDGCAVELNALWYSLLSHLENLLKETEGRSAAKPWRELRLAARRAFVERFWLEDEARLADRWVPASGAEDLAGTGEGRVDTSVRPNMVLAAALELSPLTRAQRGAVVECARRELLTPFGLRTLSPSDPRYRGVFAGGPAERDGAYHQGTVWPWLLGFFAEASVRATTSSKKNLATALALWDPLLEHTREYGIGHMSEVFDGDAPHAPGGSFAQAWNTAEYLRTRHAARAGGF